MADIVRSARTSQTPNDLAKKYDELLAIDATRRDAVWMSYQAHCLKHEQQRRMMDRRRTTRKGVLAIRIEELESKRTAALKAVSCTYDGAIEELKKEKEALEAPEARARADAVVPMQRWKTLNNAVPKMSEARRPNGVPSRLTDLSRRPHVPLRDHQRARLEHRTLRVALLRAALQARSLCFL